MKFDLTMFIHHHRDKIILSLIVLVSFVIRYIGLKFSYPLLTHADEPFILNPVYEMTVNQTLDSNVFNRPNQVLIPLNLLILNFISFVKFGSNLSTTFLDNKLFFYYSSRTINAIFGAMLPWAAWKIGKESKPDFSIPAALLFGFFPSYVLYSHYITPDVPTTLFTLLIILFAFRYAKTGRPAQLHIATFFAAVNTAEKYPGLISLSIVYLAIFVREISLSHTLDLTTIKKIILGALKSTGIYCLSVYIVAPNLFIEYGKTIQAIRFESQSTHLGGDNLGWIGNMFFYASQYFRQANWLLILFLFVGGYVVYTQRELAMVFALYGVLYWIVISVLKLHWERWAQPMYTAPLLFSAYGAVGPIGWLKRWKQGYLIRNVLFGIAVSLVLLNSLSNSIVFTYQDTRYAALLFCQENGIKREESLYEPYTPFSPTLEAGPGFHERYQQGEKFKYIIISSGMYGRYEAEPQRYAQQLKNYTKIRQENRLVAEFSSTTPPRMSIIQQVDATWYYLQRFFGKKLPDRYTGPTIQIYEIVE